MLKSPIECVCSSCECGILTYNESKVCVKCENEEHNAGAKRYSAKQKEMEEKEKQEQQEGQESSGPTTSVK